MPPKKGVGKGGKERAGSENGRRGKVAGKGGESKGKDGGAKGGGGTSGKKGQAEINISKDTSVSLFGNLANYVEFFSTIHYPTFLSASTVPKIKFLKRVCSGSQIELNERLSNLAYFRKLVLYQQQKN